MSKRGIDSATEKSASEKWADLHLARWKGKDWRIRIIDKLKELKKRIIKK